MHELMGWKGPLTHRQYQAWCEWYMDNPSRSDWYAAQTALEVRRVFGKGKLEDMRLRPKDGGGKDYSPKEVEMMGRIRHGRRNPMAKMATRVEIPPPRVITPAN